MCMHDKYFFPFYFDIFHIDQENDRNVFKFSLIICIQPIIVEINEFICKINVFVINIKLKIAEHYNIKNLNDFLSDQNT